MSESDIIALHAVDDYGFYIQPQMNMSAGYYHFYEGQYDVPILAYGYYCKEHGGRFVFSMGIESDHVPRIVELEDLNPASKYIRVKITEQFDS